jgi:hypothetical protein
MKYKIPDTRMRHVHVNGVQWSDHARIRLQSLQPMTV